MYEEVIIILNVYASNTRVLKIYKAKFHGSERENIKNTQLYLETSKPYTQ